MAIIVRREDLIDAAPRTCPLPVPLGTQSTRSPSKASELEGAEHRRGRSTRVKGIQPLLPIKNKRDTEDEGAYRRKFAMGPHPTHLDLIFDSDEEPRNEGTIETAPPTMSRAMSTESLLQYHGEGATVEEEVDSKLELEGTLPLRSEPNGLRFSRSRASLSLIRHGRSVSDGYSGPDFMTAAKASAKMRPRSSTVGGGATGQVTPKEVGKLGTSLFGYRNGPREWPSPAIRKQMPSLKLDLDPWSEPQDLPKGDVVQKLEIETQAAGEEPDDLRLTPVSEDMVSPAETMLTSLCSEASEDKDIKPSTENDPDQLDASLSRTQSSSTVTRKLKPKLSNLSLCKPGEHKRDPDAMAGNALGLTFGWMPADKHPDAAVLKFSPVSSSQWKPGSPLTEKEIKRNEGIQLLLDCCHERGACSAIPSSSGAISCFDGKAPACTSFVGTSSTPDLVGHFSPCDQEVGQCGRSGAINIQLPIVKQSRKENLGDPLEPPRALPQRRLSEITAAGTPL